MTYGCVWELEKKLSGPCFEKKWDLDCWVVWWNRTIAKTNSDCINGSDLGKFSIFGVRWNFGMKWYWRISDWGICPIECGVRWRERGDHWDHRSGPSASRHSARLRHVVEKLTSGVQPTGLLETPLKFNVNFGQFQGKKNALTEVHRRKEIEKNVKKKEEKKRSCQKECIENGTFCEPHWFCMMTNMIV